MSYPVYKSKYYTADQIDRRLLQGYFDDAVAAGYQGNRAEFLNQLVGLLSRATINAMISEAIAGLVDGAPEALDTLKELADWVKEDESRTTTLIEAVSTNTRNIADLTRRTVYLTEEAYQDLVKDNLIQNDVEYNILEDDES